jgi:hypothetical protein
MVLRRRSNEERTHDMVEKFLKTTGHTAVLKFRKQHPIHHVIARVFSILCYMVLTIR